MYRVRPAKEGDLDAIVAIARCLDTVNLPSDRALLVGVVARAVASFAGALPPFEREYLFVAEALDGGGLVGTSMVHARHGTPEQPHVFFDVVDDERYSAMLNRSVRRRWLRLGFDEDGPTELGGLTVLPALRGGGAGLGRLLSYARLVYIGAHPGCFRDQLLAELLPPFEPDGSSRLWDALGRPLTGLGYREADRLSHRGKEFIRALFPVEPIFVGALPEPAQALIGAVGSATRGVERMLGRIGFAWRGRIDPFDGGPHLTARRDEVTLLRTLGRATVVDGAASGPWGIVAAGSGASFRALGLPLWGSDGKVALPAAARAALEVGVGASVWVQPMSYVTNFSATSTSIQETLKSASACSI